MKLMELEQWHQCELAWMLLTARLIIKNQHRFIARSFLSQLSQISFMMDLFILIPRVNESVFCLSVLSDSKHQAHSLWLKM